MHRRRTLASLPLVLPLCGCNPLVFDKILEDSPVEEFEVKGPDGRPALGLAHIVYEEVGDGVGHLVTAGPQNVALARIALSEGAEPVIEAIEREAASELILPIESRTALTMGGMARVPSPTEGDEAEHAVASFVATAERRKTRIIRFNASTFVRTDEPDADIVIPDIDGTVAPDFGFGLAAINLDADQDDPDYELVVGTDIGVLVYDNLGKNAATYAENKAAIEAMEDDPFAGDKEADGRFFTVCENLAGFNGLAAGPFLAGEAPAFVVGMPTGLVLVAEQDVDDPDDAKNRVGAPVYDCERGTRDAPGDAEGSFGASLFVTDFDDDGIDDLVVGDPTANRVFLYRGTADGLEDAPVDTLQPGGDTAGDAKEFGASLGRANLDPGKLEVLAVGAPGTTVDGKDEVGSVHIFELGGNDWLVTLEDLTPSSGTRHGTWAGGVFRDDRDELVVMGTLEGRVHSRIVERDPKPGG